MDTAAAVILLTLAGGLDKFNCTEVVCDCESSLLERSLRVDGARRAALGPDGSRTYVCLFEFVCERDPPPVPPRPHDATLSARFALNGLCSAP